MVTITRHTRKMKFYQIIGAVVCLLVLPSTSLAGLQPMEEKEMKAVYFNDFKRPSQIPTIIGPDQKELTGFEHRVEAVPVTVQATNMTFDTESFTRDLEAQYKNIQAGGQATLPIFSNYAKTN